MRSLKCSSVGADPQDSYPSRSISADLALQPTSTENQFVYSKLICLSRRASNNVGEAVPCLKKSLVIRGNEGAFRKARRMQGTPEPVAGPCEMVANSSRVKPWVDSAEENLEAGFDYVWQAPAVAR